MRIGIICHASYGGSSKVAINLAAHLAMRHTVHVFAIHKPHFCHNLEKLDNVIFHEITLPNALNWHPAELQLNWPDHLTELFLEKLLTVTAQENLDILHFHYAIPFAKFAVTVKNKLKEKSPAIIGTLHGTDITMHDTYADSLKNILAQVDLLTTASEYYADLARNVYSLSQKPLAIPNFIDLHDFRMNVQSNKIKEPYKIIHVSNFRPIKNSIQLAEIFMLIHKKIPSRLCLIGDGPQMPSIKKIFAEHGLAHDVEYYGLQQKIIPFIADADLLLMSSKSESFCLSALEAIAAGVPVIAPRVGGLPELIVSGKHGFLYPPDDINCAAKHAIALLNNRVQHENYRHQARLRAHEFDQDRIVPIYEQLYLSLKSSAM